MDKIKNNQILLFVITTAISFLVAFCGWYYVSRNSIIRAPGIKGAFLLAVMAAFLFIIYAGIYELIKVRISLSFINLMLSILTLFFTAVCLKALLDYTVVDGVRYYRFPQIAAILSIESAALLIHSIRYSAHIKQRIAKSNGLLISIMPAVIILVFGVFLCVYLPVSTGITWDDSIHYERTVMFSQGVYATVSETDLDIIYQKNPNDFIQREENATFLENENTKSFCILTDAKAILPERVCYIGYAIGIWFSQLFGLPYYIQFFISKISNLLIYSIVMYAAINQLHSGKSLLIMVGLVPTIIFMASGYSYDPWLISFSSLAFATFFGAIQEENEMLDNKKIAIMLGSMLLGVLPKAGYSVLFLLFLLMPDSKFTCKSQKKKYIALVLAMLVLTLAYFLIEYFAFGNMGDARGGDGVDASAQIEFILSNPLESFRVIASFLIRYIKQVEYLTAFAYILGKVWVLLLLRAL